MFSENDCHTGAGTGSQPETDSGAGSGDAPYRRADFNNQSLGNINEYGANKAHT